MSQADFIPFARCVEETASRDSSARSVMDHCRAGSSLDNDAVWACFKGGWLAG